VARRIEIVMPDESRLRVRLPEQMSADGYLGHILGWRGPMSSEPPDFVPVEPDEGEAARYVNRGAIMMVILIEDAEDAA
jgi:hypothetical protein